MTVKSWMPMSPKILRHSVSFTCLPGNKAVSLASSLAKIRASAALAQLVEHRIRNAGVACSSHAGGTTYLQPFYSHFSEPHRTIAYRASNNVCLFRKLILKHKNRLVAGYKTGLDYDYHSGSNLRSDNSGCAGKNRRACPQVG